MLHQKSASNSPNAQCDRLPVFVLHGELRGFYTLNIEKKSNVSYCVTHKNYRKSKFSVCI